MPATSEKYPGWCTTATAGVQYLAIRYTERLDAAGAVRSMGCKGDAYGNAAAESLIGLYKQDAREDQQLEEAFVGHLTDHHAFLLRTMLARIPPTSRRSRPRWRT